MAERDAPIDVFPNTREGRRVGIPRLRLVVEELVARLALREARIAALGEELDKDRRRLAQVQRHLAQLEGEGS